MCTFHPSLEGFFYQISLQFETELCDSNASQTCLTHHLPYTLPAFAFEALSRGQYLSLGAVLFTFLTASRAPLHNLNQPTCVRNLG
jgi:hypothetical protein